MGSKHLIFHPQQFKNLNSSKKKIIQNKNVKYAATDTVELIDWILAGQGKGILNSGLYSAKVHIDTLKNTITFEKKILRFAGVEYDEKKGTLNSTKETYVIRRLNRKELVLSCSYLFEGKKVYSIYYFKAVI